MSQVCNSSLGLNRDNRWGCHSRDQKRLEFQTKDNAKVGAVSFKVKDRLRRLNIDTTHEERLAIDREIAARTGLPSDVGIERLTEQEFIEIVNRVKGKRYVLAEALA